MVDDEINRLKVVHFDGYGVRGRVAGQLNVVPVGLQVGLAVGGF